MAREDQLFTLIKSLTKAQKRYIKVNSTHIIGKKNNYMRLFDALDKMDSYDEQKLIHKFKGTNFINHLPSEKNYLFEFILKNMRSYNTDRTISFSIQSLLQDIYFLYEKGMHDSCLKKIKKAKKICYKYGTFSYLLELLEWERKLLKFKFNDDLNNKIKEQMDEMNEVMELIKNEREYMNLYDKLNLTLKDDFYSISEERMKRMKELMQDSLLTNPSSPKSINAEIYYHECFITFYQLTKEVHKNLEHNIKLVELWESRPELVKEKQNRYKHAIHNLAGNAYASGNFEAFQEALAKMKSIPARTLREEAEDFQSIYFLELFFYLNNNQIDKALKLAPEISAALDRYDELIRDSRLIGFRYNLAVLYFLNEDYASALEWIEKIMDMKLDTRLDIQHFSRILYLIIHYEISEPQVVQYIYGNTYRYLYRNERINKFEKVIFGYVRKLNKLLSKKEMRAVFQELLDELETIKTEKPNTIGLEELICWIASKTEDRPMIDILRDRIEAEHKALEEKKLKESAN